VPVVAVEAAEGQVAVEQVAGARDLLEAVEAYPHMPADLLRNLGNLRNRSLVAILENSALGNWAITRPVVATFLRERVDWAQAWPTRGNSKVCSASSRANSAASSLHKTVNINRMHKREQISFKAERNRSPPLGMLSIPMLGKPRIHMQALRS